MKGQISACHSSTEGKMDSGQEQLNCRKIGLSTSMYTGVCSTSCVSWFKSEGAAGTRGRNELKAPRSPSGLRNMGPPECGPNESLYSALLVRSCFLNNVTTGSETPATHPRQQVSRGGSKFSFPCLSCLPRAQVPDQFPWHFSPPWSKTERELSFFCSKPFSSSPQLRAHRAKFSHWHSEPFLA